MGLSSTGRTLGAVLHHVARGATEHTKIVVHPALAFGGGQLAIFTQLVIHVVVSGLSGGRGVTGGVRFGVGVGLVLALGVGVRGRVRIGVGIGIGVGVGVGRGVSLGGVGGLPLGRGAGAAFLGLAFPVASIHTVSVSIWYFFVAQR